jgi:molecular chaperone HscA
MAALRAARAGSVASVIKQAIHDVDQATRDFAMRRMDAGVRAALAGHRLDEFRS